MNAVGSGRTGFLIATLVTLVLAAACDDESAPVNAGSDDAGCAGCHADVAAAWGNASSHSLIYSCADCHADAGTDPGPGHRTAPWCDQCHSEAAHPPDGGWAVDLTCRTCHDPHGSPNLFLVPETIPVDGVPVSVDFRNTDGYADYSFAEPGEQDGGTNDRGPGTGLCEVCHDRTRYYDRTGTGAPHYTARCTVCHDHAEAFAATNS
jgi:hypothetical protein